MSDPVMRQVRFHGGPLDNQVREMDTRSMPLHLALPVEGAPFMVTYELKLMNNISWRYICLEIDEWQRWEAESK